MGRYQQRDGVKTKRVDELKYRDHVKREERGSIKRTQGKGVVRNIQKRRCP